MPSFTDIDSDGDQDLFITVLGGTGGIQLVNNFYFYENVSEAEESNYNFITNDYLNTIDHLSDTCPTFIDIDSDGDQDLFIGQKFATDTTPFNGRIIFYLNTGNGNTPIFTLYDDIGSYYMYKRNKDIPFMFEEMGETYKYAISAFGQIL